MVLSLLTASAVHARTVVQFKIGQGSQTRTFYVELFDEIAPITVANFLDIVNRGDYNNTFFHRLAPGFVLQGGGFKTPFSSTATVPVPTVEPIINEFSVSNTRGTIAMARLGGDPNSATTQWFFNLANSNTFLDDVDGGFTVFGRLVGTGLDIIDLLVRDFPSTDLGGVFSELPASYTTELTPGEKTVPNDGLLIIKSITISQKPSEAKANSLYFPILPQSSDGFNGLALSNRSAKTAKVTLTTFSDGSSTTGTLEIPAGAQVAKLVTEVFGDNTPTPGWIRLDSELLDSDPKPPTFAILDKHPTIDCLNTVFDVFVEVFGMYVVSFADAPRSYVLHSANVLAEYIDNDFDGVPDEPAVLNYLVENKYVVPVWSTELFQTLWIDPEMTAGFTGDCLHDNMNFGASMYYKGEETDTWALGGIKQAGIWDGNLEEIWHVLTRGWSAVYPEAFGNDPEDINQTSLMRAAMDKARGGKFETVPEKYPEDAWYKYDDAGCLYACQYAEYFYWALMSNIGALESLTNKCAEEAHQWAICTRSDLEKTDPAVYSLLNDPKFQLPKNIPQGKYPGSLASFFQFGKSDLSQLDGGVAVPEQSKTFYFTRVLDGPTSFRGQSATTTLSILNPNATSVILRLTYVSPDKTEIFVLPISASSAVFKSASDLFGNNLSGGYIKADVIQGAGAIGFEIIELQNTSTVLGLNAVLENIGNQGFSAQLAISDSLFTNLNIVNTTSKARSVTLTAIDSDGITLGNPVEINVASGGQLSQDARTLFADPPQGFTGSLKVVADGPGVVGDVIFGDSLKLDYSALLLLQMETFEEAIFPQLANGSGFFTGVALFNPGAVDATLTFKVVSSLGAVIGQVEEMLGAGKRVSKLVDQFVTSSAGQVGGFVSIVSNQPLVGQMLFGVVGANGITLFSAVPPTIVR